MFRGEHYKKIAKIFYDMKPVKSDLETFDEYTARLNYYNRIIARFSLMFEKDNKNYNHSKFYSAIE